MVVRWILWDDHNITHIARHSVTPAEVEQVVYLDGEAQAFTEDRHRAGRLLVLGKTAAGRHFLVALDAPTSHLDRYVVTARPMTAREQNQYEEQ